MKNAKRFLALMLSLICTVSLLSLSVFADTTTTDTAQINVVVMKNTANDAINVRVYIENNPGFNLLNFDLNYNKSVVTPITSKDATDTEIKGSGAVTVGSVVSDCVFSTGLENGTEGKLMFNCMSASETTDASTSGLLLSVKFDVLDTTSTDYGITFSLTNDSSGNFIKSDYTEIPFVSTVYTRLAGDVNESGTITTGDILLTRKLIALITDPTIPAKYYMDVNGDGSIGTSDLLKLRKYIAYGTALF